MSIGLQDAMAQAAEAARQLGDVAHSARRQVVELTVELEEARQELGRLRLRDMHQRAVLRRIVDENVEAVVPPTDVLFEVRQLLGLDGRDGSAQLEQEACRG